MPQTNRQLEARIFRGQKKALGALIDRVSRGDEDAERRLAWLLWREAVVLAGPVFRFPNTDAPMGYGELDELFSRKDGLLSAGYGYKTGSDGLSRSERWAVLTRAYAEPIGLRSHLFPAEYVAEWGEAWTAARLKKIADSIAAWTRNVKRQRNAALVHGSAS